MWFAGEAASAGDRLPQSVNAGERSGHQANAHQVRRRVQPDTTAQHVHRVGAPDRRGVLQPGENIFQKNLKNFIY